MCGIGGWYANEPMTRAEVREAMARWQEMMVLLEVRGTDAAGVFMVADDGHIKFAKTPGPARLWVGSLNEAEGRLPIVIGHTRHATQGDPRNNANNHPFIIDPIVGVHNGVYSGYALAAKTFKLAGACDSEAIFAQLAAAKNEAGYLTTLAGINPFNRVVFWNTRRSKLYAFSGDSDGLVLAYDKRLPVTWVASAETFLPASACEEGSLDPRTLYTLVHHKEAA